MSGRFQPYENDEMARSHLRLDADIPRFMVLAVALSAAGLFGLQSVGVGRTLPLPASIPVFLCG